MSYRELRNFTEMLRTLGYSRLVSMENFRQPNFPLVAEILLWLIKRFEPEAEIPSDIDTESDRVFFIKAAAQFIATKAYVKLNTKKLYRADGYAVKELLKVTDVLFQAVQGDGSGDQNEADSRVSSLSFDFNNKLHELKQTRALASEITTKGAALFDLLNNEVDLRETRNLAISKQLEIENVEKELSKSLHEVNNQIQETISMMDNLAHDEETLASKVDKKKVDLERHQKRLASLQSVRPAFMDEYEKLESELQKQYEVYVEKFRNISYLEHQLEEHNRAEQDRFEETEEALKRMQTRLREEEKRVMMGDVDAYQEGNSDEESSLEEVGAPPAGRAAPTRHVQGNLMGGDDSQSSRSDEETDSLIDDDEDGDSESDSDDEFGAERGQDDGMGLDSDNDF